MSRPKNFIVHNPFTYGIIRGMEHRHLQDPKSLSSTAADDIIARGVRAGT